MLGFTDLNPCKKCVSQVHRYFRPPLKKCWPGAKHGIEVFVAKELVVATEDCKEHDYYAAAFISYTANFTNDI